MPTTKASPGPLRLVEDEIESIDEVTEFLVFSAPAKALETARAHFVASAGAGAERAVAASERGRVRATDREPRSGNDLALGRRRSNLRDAAFHGKRMQYPSSRGRPVPPSPLGAIRRDRPRERPVAGAPLPAPCRRALRFRPNPSPSSLVGHEHVQSSAPRARTRPSHRERTNAVNHPRSTAVSSLVAEAASGAHSPAVSRQRAKFPRPSSPRSHAAGFRHIPETIGALRSSMGLPRLAPRAWLPRRSYPRGRTAVPPGRHPNRNERGSQWHTWLPTSS